MDVIARGIQSLWQQGLVGQEWHQEFVSGLPAVLHRVKQDMLDELYRRADAIDQNDSAAD